MATFARHTSFVLLLVGTAIAGSPPTVKSSNDVSIVRPGAPGQDSKVLPAANVQLSMRAPSEADISFMQGMIMHHSQAVEMTELLRTRSHNKDLQELGKRISISQSDEIQYMKQWLKERGQGESAMAGMKDLGDGKGMDHMAMDSMPAMPGMLTAEQMSALSKATGPAFDHLFLTGMIQHHTGALTMVQDLFDTPGAGQDSVLFDFATDVDNTQRAEIRIMQKMLTEKR